MTLLTAGTVVTRPNQDYFQRRKADSIVLLGHSIVANNGQLDGELDPHLSASNTNRFHGSFGFFSWAQVMLRHRLRLLYNAGIAGQSMAQIVARIPTDVLPYSPSMCLLDGWINSINSDIAAPTITAQAQAGIQQMLNAGITVILCTAMPSGNTIPTPSRQSCWQAVNTWCRWYASITPGVVLCDWTASCTDPSTGAFQSAFTVDGTHPNVAGASRMGRVLANVLEPLVTGSDSLITSNFDSRCITPNPMMLAGAGSGNLATGVSGTCASTWQNSWNGAPGSAVLSLVPKESTLDAQGNWQDIQITGAGDFRYEYLYASSSIPVANYWAECEYEVVTPFVGLTWLELILFTDAANGGVAGDLYNSSYGAGVEIPPSGVLRTPLIPAATSASPSVRPRFHLICTSGEIRISRLAVRSDGPIS